MSAVSITSINVHDNPAPFRNPLQFEIHYECLSDLENDLQWKLIYVGSAESEDHDQVLDDVHVGPVKQGKFKFVLQTPAPDPALIPKADIVGITVILLTCSYKDAEFLRVGYYTQNEYEDEALRENPPDTPDIDRLQRRIIDENPRVTRFQNRFDGPEDEEDEPPVDAAELAEADDDLVIAAGGGGGGADGGVGGLFDDEMEGQENGDANAGEEGGEEAEEEDDEDGGKGE